MTTTTTRTTRHPVPAEGHAPAKAPAPQGVAGAVGRVEPTSPRAPLSADTTPDPIALTDPAAKAAYAKARFVMAHGFYHAAVGLLGHAWRAEQQARAMVAVGPYAAGCGTCGALPGEPCWSLRDATPNQAPHSGRGAVAA